MYKVPLQDIKDKIIASGKLNNEELTEKIKSKITELSGLISEEGAAHIIANELGVELVPPQKDQLKIKEIYAGMRNISTTGKVVQKYDVREFAKGDSTGKVCSLVIGDDSGTIRVVFWNEQVEQLTSVNVDDIVQLKDVYVRENRGGKEIHMGDKGDLTVNPEGVTVENVRKQGTFERKKISDLQDGDGSAEILGTVVQVFDPRFFNVHPETGKRIREGEEAGVTPVTSYVMNLVLDDGSGTIRGVFWKNQTNNLLDKTDEEVAVYKEDLASFENMKTDLLGEQFKISGRVKKNDMFDRLEFNAQLVEKAKPEDEIARLEVAE